MKLCCFSVFVLAVFIQDVLSDRFLSCKTPTLKYGRIKSRQRGRTLKFVCNPGYQLAGDRTAFCINGTWDMPIPRCVRGSCPKKDSPPQNGLVLPSHGGAVLNYYCREGYELNGPAAVFCDGFNWDNHKPSCLPSSTKPNLFCDFEDAVICHWTHDLNHDMDWVRDSYKTPTGYSMATGPSFDHTKGAGSNGHYMYIESSSRRINDTARLISPIFGKMDGNVCLEFWYHMYGNTTGTLKAYMKKTSDPWPLNPANAIFSKSGNQGNVWYRAFIDMGSISEDFQIIMEGIRGNGYVSDIAIDDVNIMPNCVYEDHTESTIEFTPSESEILKTVESCENRCGQKAFGNESSLIIACDCDDFCYETSRCCPDYVDFCLNSSTIDWTTITEESETVTEGLVVSSNATAKNITTVRSTLKSTIATTKATTKIQVVPTTKKPTSTTKIVTPPTKKPDTPQKPNNIPTLIILQRPTTPMILEKIIPKFPPNKNQSKITFVKPKLPQTTVSGYHDDIQVPTRPANADVELLLSSPFPIDEDSNDINDVSIQEQEGYVEHIGEIKTEFKQTQEEDLTPKQPSTANLPIVALATVCGVVVLGILVGVALVKFRFIRMRNRRMASGQGDSQSDVRFLTADEVLDFNLDKDYDEL